MNHYEARAYAQHKCREFLRYCAANPPVNLPQPLLVKPATPPPPVAKPRLRGTGVLDRAREYLRTAPTPATIDEIVAGIGLDVVERIALTRALHNASYMGRDIIKAGKQPKPGHRPVVLWGLREEKT